jgi:superfamily II DNA/RNA helicase
VLLLLPRLLLPSPLLPSLLLLQVVLNFDAPRSLETYLHRVGRTARAGSEGLAVSLMTDEDRGLLKSVVKQGKVQLKQRVVPQQVGAAEVQGCGAAAGVLRSDVTALK